MIDFKEQLPSFNELTTLKKVKEIRKYKKIYDNRELELKNKLQKLPNGEIAYNNYLKSLNKSNNNQHFKIISFVDFCETCGGNGLLYGNDEYENHDMFCYKCQDVVKFKTLKGTGKLRYSFKIYADGKIEELKSTPHLSLGCLGLILTLIAIPIYEFFH